MLNTQVGNFGVTESQLVVVAIHIGAAIGGQSMWAVSLNDILPASVSSLMIDNGMSTFVKTGLYVYIVYFILIGVTFGSMVCIKGVLSPKEGAGSSVR